MGGIHSRQPRNIQEYRQLGVRVADWGFSNCLHRGFHAAAQLGPFEIARKTLQEDLRFRDAESLEVNDRAACTRKNPLALRRYGLDAGLRKQAPPWKALGAGRTVVNF